MKQALAAAESDLALGAAFRLHRAGQLPDAIIAYREILDADGSNANAAFLCGMAALQAGAHGPAANLFAGAIQIDADRADFHANLGIARAQDNDVSAAMAPLTRAMLLEPRTPSIAFNLGQITDRAGMRERAFMAFRASAHLQPEHATSWIEYGAAARTVRRAKVANLALLHALTMGPDAPRAWFNIAMLRADQGLDEDAEIGFRNAMELDPDYAEAVGNLGNHLRARKRREEARTVLLDGVRRHPSSALLWAGLSAVDFDADRIGQASVAAKRACAIDPTLVDATANLGQCLHRIGATAAAVRLGVRATLLVPDDPRLQFNLATYLLGDGELGPGWDAYEARLAKVTTDGIQGLPAQRWVAGKPPGRRLFIVAEQGLGDEVLFASCFPDLLALLQDNQLDALAVECDARLIPLFQRSFPGVRVFERITTRLSNDRPPDYTRISAEFGADCHVFSGSLPGLFRRKISDFDRPANPFVANPERMAYWRSFLGSRTAMPVFGLSWRSTNARDKADVYYPPISSLAPILTLPGIRFVTLQYDDPEPELRQIEKTFGIEIIRPEGLDPMNDLDDVAALISVTRGVVSPNNSVLILAGAMAVPAFIATHGYLWSTLGTGALPWYPKIAIEMRTAAKGWDEAISALAARLRAALKA
jgi:tetratricopeptide (TPR) repeat protein